MIEFNKKLMYISLSIYILLLIWIVIFKWTNYQAAEESIITYRHMDLYERYLVCKPKFRGIDSIDLILNMLLFLPMGIFFVLLLKRKYLTLLIGFIFTLSFEVSQFFTCIGMFSYSDILGNMLGCFIGYILYLFIKSIINKKIIDIVNIVIISIFSPLCIYAIIMTIINFNSYL